MGFFLFCLIIWIICGFIGMKLGEERSIGKGGGALLGFFLGIFGVLILICMQKSQPDNKTSYSVNPSLQPQPIPMTPPKTEAPTQAFFAEDSIKECPYCFESIKKQARYCEHCKKDISYVPDNTPIFPAPEDLVIETKTSS